MKLFIYGLYDISDAQEKIVYVGITRNLRQRKLSHCGHAKRSVGRWIKEVRMTESDVGMRVLEVTDTNSGMVRELYWISHLKPMLNAEIKESQVKKTAPFINVKENGFCGFSGTLQELQLAYIQHIIEACSGNRYLAAHKLGIGRQTLYNKLALLK